MFGIGRKFVAATLAAEVEQFSLMLMDWLAGRCIDSHAADRVDCRSTSGSFRGLTVAIRVFLRNHGFTPPARRI